MFTPLVMANNFSPVVERQKREGNVSLEKALERSSVRARYRRPGLGSFTRRVKNGVRTTAEQTQTPAHQDRKVRATTRRLGGGRNGYARYLRSLEMGNHNRVSRLRPGRVTADQTADTEANTR